MRPGFLVLAMAVLMGACSAAQVCKRPEPGFRLLGPVTAPFVAADWSATPIYACNDLEKKGFKLE